MTDAEKRKEVSSMYPGPNWARKVARMSDAQVFAIWAKKQKPQVKEEKKDDNSDIPF